MKRFYIFFSIVLVLVIIATSAYASIFDRFVDVALNKVVTMAVAGIFIVLSTFFGVKVLKYKRVVEEGKDCALWLYQATREDSKGGAKITGEELQEGLKEFGEFGVAVLAVVKNKE